MKSSVQTLKSLFLEKLPIYLIFYVTSRCNFRCPFCFYLDNIEEAVKNELNLDEIEKISQRFGQLVQLSLTGGEPFLRRELPDICEIFVRNNSVKYVSIPTNGSLPDRVIEVVTHLLTTYPKIGFRIPISIDGIEEDHDETRQVSGSFKKLMATFHRLSDLRDGHSNLIVDVNTTLSASNADKVPGVIEWVRENMTANNHSLTYVRGDVRDKALMEVSADQYRKCIKMLQENPKRSENRIFSGLLRSVIEESWETIAKTIENDEEILPCMAGRKLVIINEKGEVFPCEILGKSFGSLRQNDYDIEKILFSNSSNELKNKIREDKCHCTFECAVNTNVVFNKKTYPKLFMRTLGKLGKIQNGAH